MLHVRLPPGEKGSFIFEQVAVSSSALVQMSPFRAIHVGTLRRKCKLQTALQTEDDSVCFRLACANGRRAQRTGGDGRGSVASKRGWRIGEECIASSLAMKNAATYRAHRRLQAG